jgi:hypothetical protein
MVRLRYWTQRGEVKRLFVTEQDALKFLLGRITLVNGWQIEMTGRENNGDFVSSDMSPSETSRLVLGAL